MDEESLQDLQIMSSETPTSSAPVQVHIYHTFFVKIPRYCEALHQRYFDL